MENEMLLDDTPKNDESNYNSSETAGDQNPGETKAANSDSNKKLPTQQDANKNSAAKAMSRTRSAVANTNPNIRTGLSDDLNNTGTNVAYTEREN